MNSNPFAWPSSRDIGAVSAPVARNDAIVAPQAPSAYGQSNNRVNVVEVMPNPNGDGSTTTVVRRGMAASTDEIG